MIRSTIAFGFAVICLYGCVGEFAADSAKIQADEQAYDPVLMEKSLDEIEAWHIENETGVANILGAGRSLSFIAAQFENADCTLTEELKVLWSWHDGGVSSVPFVWYHNFLRLQDALSEYRWLRLNPVVQWDPRYIPIFSFDGEWFAAYCGEGANKAGAIVHYFLEDEPRIAYVNLTAFLASMADGLRSGGIHWQGGATKDDIWKMYLVYQKRNPGYGFAYNVADAIKSASGPGVALTSSVSSLPSRAVMRMVGRESIG